MDKTKIPKPKGVANKHLHARTSFLYQAATFLTLQATQTALEPAEGVKREAQQPPVHSRLALRLGSDLQQVSRKGQLRLSQDVKRSLCKRCNAVLIPGCTSITRVENRSRDGRKRCADVAILDCMFCGGRKRFPIGATRQTKKKKRSRDKATEDTRKLAHAVDKFCEKS